MNAVTVRKRFSAFILTAGLMTVSGFVVPESSLNIYINALLVLYGLYAGGQTATDYVKAKGGG